MSEELGEFCTIKERFHSFKKIIAYDVPWSLIKIVIWAIRAWCTILVNRKQILSFTSCVIGVAMSMLLCSSIILLSIQSKALKLVAWVSWENIFRMCRIAVSVVLSFLSIHWFCSFMILVIVILLLISFIILCKYDVLASLLQTIWLWIFV